MSDIPRRVVLVYWKERAEGSFEIYSSLKNFCSAVPRYNYNTLSNYLSKKKIAYEDQQIRIERQPVITTPVNKRAIVPVVVRKKLTDDDDSDDLAYWLSKTPGERVAAAAALSTGALKKETKMDRTHIVRRN
jgi:hypothetical protein